jgi:type II secretory pathway pseudopilin PulG
MVADTQQSQRTAGTAGYSLVEVTLALLVVAIGLTATFALFPEGLRATRSAVDDTEIAMFAEYVFTTLDLTAGRIGGNYGTDWDINDTDEFRSLMLSRYASPTNFQLEVGGFRQFYWIPDYYGLASGDYQASGFQDFWTSAFTYSLTMQVSTWKGYGSGVPTLAVLKVWPGAVKGRDQDARIFYREILPLR